jgi:ATP-dependent DNA helicase RecQ
MNILLFYCLLVNLLSCIYKLDENYGVTKVAKVLSGSRAKQILKLGLDEVSTYGIMSNKTIKEIKNLTKFLIAEKYIELTEGKYATTKLADKAYPVLEDEARVEMKVRQETEQIAGTNELFETLRDLRKEIAAEEAVPPFIIFPDSSLRDMVDKLPATNKEMLKVKGVGTTKLQDYGQRFLEKIKEATNRGHDDQSSPDVENSTASYIKSYKLYRAGNDLERVADLRDLTKGTIQKHILRAIKEGLDVDIESFVTAEQQELISKEINNQEEARLKPIKEALPEEISYFQIRVILYQVLNQE